MRVPELNNLRDVLSESDIEKYQSATVTVEWNNPALARIVRLRFLTDPGFPFMDVSYCWGDLHDGTPARVDLPFGQLPKRNFKGALLDYARRDNVYLKGLGVFDAVSILF